MLIALILILTWPSPCIQALYLIAVLLAAGEPSKAQHQAQSTKQSHTKHKAEPSPAISHQPSAIRTQAPITHHHARQHRTEAQAPITHHQACQTNHPHMPIFHFLSFLMPFFQFHFCVFAVTFFGLTASIRTSKGK